MEKKQPTPSQKLRSVIYRVWEKQAHEHMSFLVYYERRMNQITEKMKLELD